MRHFVVPGLLCVLVALCGACGNAQPTVTVPPPPPPTMTAVPTATITPVPLPPTPTPAFLPSPTPDPREPTYPPGTLRNANWPVGTAAVAAYTAKTSVDIDVGAVVLTVPIPEGTTVSLYVAIPPQRGYAGRVNFPISPRAMSLQPGDAIRIIGVTAGTVRVPPTEGTYVVVNINGQRFARNNEPLSG